MTDDEIIAVVQAHKEGKQIQCKFLNDSSYDWWDSKEGPGWDFERMQYRIKPEPRKPREWWIEPLKYGLCRINKEPSTCALWHVREVIEDDTEHYCS